MLILIVWTISTNQNFTIRLYKTLVWRSINPISFCKADISIIKGCVYGIRLGMNLIRNDQQKRRSNSNPYKTFIKYLFLHDQVFRVLMCLWSINSVTKYALINHRMRKDLNITLTTKN